MKKALKISAIVILAILLILIVLPFAFKGKIINAIKEETNKNVNAMVDFKGVGLNFFASFPNLTLSLNELTIVGKEPFTGDTLAGIEALKITVDLWDILFSGSYSVEKISLIKPDILLKVLKDGKANWDIAMPGDTTIMAEADTTPSDFKLTLKKVEITDGTLVYDDASLVTYVSAAGFNHILKGDLTADITTLETQTSIEALSVDYENFRYLSKTKATLAADIEADLNNFSFKFSDNELKLNEFVVFFEGMFGIAPNDDYTMDISFKAPSDDFRALLSLVPAIYQKDFASLKATGKLAFDGKVKGIYNDNTIPGFNVNLAVSDGSFRYESLPRPVEKIAVKTSIANPDGVPDHTVITVDQFHVEMAGNPLDVKLLLKTPVSDPYIESAIKGKIDLKSVQEFYPLDEKTELSGIIESDLFLKGNQSMIEQKKFSEFQAKGSMQANNLIYSAPDFTYGKVVADMLFAFEPAFVEMSRFSLNIGKTGLSANGKLENYLAYFLSEGTLRGQLNLKSNQIDLNDFMPATDSTASAESDTLSMAAIQVPANIDFTMKSEIGKLIFDNMEMSNVVGVIQVRDQQVMLNNLSMGILDGSMKVTGAYDSRDINLPKAGFDFNLIDIDIQKATTTFEMINRFAPILQKVSGKMTLGMNMTTHLDSGMNPDYKSINGKGTLKTGNVVINKLSVLDKLSGLLKINELKDVNVNPVNLSFEIAEGLIGVKPFEVKMGDITSTAGGTAGLDQALNFFMDMNFPMKYFGSAANTVLGNLVSEASKSGADIKLGNTVPVSALITGTVTDPTVKVSLKDARGKLADEIKQKALDEFNKVKTQAADKVKEEVQKQRANAKAEADKIISDAKTKADQLVSEARKKAAELEQTAVEASVKAKAEADKQAQALIAEGKKNGFIAEAAAKKSAEKLKTEAYKKADKMVEESKKQGDNLVNEAQKKADALIQEAEKKAGAIETTPEK